MENNEQVPSWAKGLIDNVNSLGDQFEARKNGEKREALKALAKDNGIPEKLANKYQITDSYDQSAALAELKAEWSDLKELALTGKITDKDTGEADKAAARLAMQSEAEKLLGIECTSPSAQSKSDLQDYANKLVNE